MTLQATPGSTGPGVEQQAAAVTSDPIDHLPHWLDFWASAIGDLAWPLCVFAVICLFRNPLLALVSQLELFEGWGLRAKFNKAVSELATRAEALGLPENGQGPAADAEGRSSPATTVDVPMSDAADLRLLSPEGIVLWAWTQIEDVLNAKARDRGLGDQSSFVTAGVLQKEGLISEETATLIRDARKLRNDVAHAKSGVIDQNTAWTYMNLARRIIAAIQSGPK